VSALTFESLARHPVFVDQFALGDDGEIRHISLADAADLVLVAPATANTLGKFAHGIADDALSTLYLATRSPVMVAPADERQHVRPPGRAREPGDVARARRRDRGAGRGVPGVRLARPRPPGRGRRDRGRGARPPRPQGHDDRPAVLVTAGPTVEDIDPVRFVSNRSTGKMGYRLAEAARDRGATVTLVSGPTALAAPAGVALVPVRSAEEMSRAVAEHAASADVVAMAAAVSDYRRPRGRR
jgi:phosphopantothenoylcysteine decarboxylase/phosphopantothenate--cysteine ligase